MALPSKIEEMDKKADEMLKELEAEMAGTLLVETSAEVITPVETPIETPVIPVETPVIPPVEVPPITEPKVEPIVNAGPVIPVAPVVKEDTVDYWRNRFLVMEGKYNNEVPRQSTEVKELRGMVDNLSKKLEQALTRPTPPVEEDPTVVALKTQYPDVYTAITKMVAGVSQPQPVVTGIPDEVNNRLTAMENVTLRSLQDKFTDQLNSRVPDWSLTRDNPAFYTYLQGIDGFSGIPRITLLQHAADSYDAARVSAIYLGFTGQSQPVATPPPAIPVGEIKRDVKKVVAPASGGGSNTPTEAPVVNDADVIKLNSEIRQATTRGDTKRANELMAKLDSMFAGQALLSP